MRLAYLAPLALLIAACGTGSSPLFQGTSSGAGSSSCVAGAQQSCACPAGEPNGIQVCNADGKSFGACAGCSGGAGGAGSSSSGSSGGKTSSSGSMSSSSGLSSSSGSMSSSTGSSSSGGPCLGGGPNIDMDKDGYTPSTGDCNDCDADVNPGAAEVANKVDDDCNGKVDDLDASCDAALVIDDLDPMTAAKAVDLCKVASPNDLKDWGVLAAQWTLPDGSPPPAAELAAYHLGHGVLSGFGTNAHPQAGSKLLALSSGTARAPADVGYQSVGGYDKMITSAAPQGFPKESAACPGVVTGEPHDGAAVELTLRPPTNAHAFSFDFIFYTYEWPNYICSNFNDIFVALLTPLPAGQTDGNISFDAQKNPISVNNALLNACGCAGNPPTPCMAGGKSFLCPLGTGLLAATGFDAASSGDNTDHAATGWLRTTAATEPGQPFKIRWAVYDSGDGVLDSSTLVDHFQWVVTPVANAETVAIANPK